MQTKKIFTEQMQFACVSIVNKTCNFCVIFLCYQKIFERFSMILVEFFTPKFRLMCWHFLSTYKRSLLGLILVKIGSGIPRFRMRINMGAVLIRVDFLCLNSGTSPERVRSEPGLAVSEEIHLVLIRHPKCDFPFYWTPGTVSLSL